MEQIKKKKIIIAAAVVILVVIFEIFVIFISKPQRLRLNGGLGAIAKQKPISRLSPRGEFFKNIKGIQK